MEATADKFKLYKDHPSLGINLSKLDLDVYWTHYYTDTTTRPKWSIYWLKSMSRRRRRF